MMMILVPFIAFSLAAALFYKITHHKKANSSGTKHKLFKVMQKNGYGTTKTTATNAINYRHIKPTAHQALHFESAASKPSHSFIDVDKTKATIHSSQKKQPNQLAGNTLEWEVTPTAFSTASFNDTELEHIRAGYIHRSTGKRKISRKNRDSYITARNGKIFDARKIIKVMQQKSANENGNASHENSMALKLQLLQAGIRALMAQDELPANFTLPDNCIVHCTVKNVTYGELKQLAGAEKLTVHTMGSTRRENIIANPRTQQPKIKALKINYKIRGAKPLKH